MKKSLILVSLSLLLASGADPIPARADIRAILGKWLAKAETPNGPMEVEFELKQEGDLLTGTAKLFQGSIPLSAVKFEDPNLAIDLSFEGGTFKLRGVLKEGKFSGTWEQVGGDVKGTWTAERRAAPVVTAAAGGISGIWASVATTPNGELPLSLELKQEGDKVTGSLSSDMGSLPIQAGSFKENKLQFDVEIGTNVYRVQATLQEDKFTGNWAPAGGGEGGAWSAKRKAEPAPEAITALDGTWDSVATTSGGDLRFQMVFKQSGETVTGHAITPDGNLSIQKGSLIGDKFTFQIEFQGGTYRVDATLTGGKLTGKWSAIDGTDSGAWSAERRQK